MNGRPAKNTFYNSLFGVNIDAHGGCNLVIGAPIPPNIDVTVIGDVLDKPRYLISMSFDHNLVRRFWVNDTDRCPIHVYDAVVNVWPEIIKPDLLATRLKTGGGRIVEVAEEEIFPFFVHG